MYSYKLIGLLAGVVLLTVPHVASAQDTTKMIPGMKMPAAKPPAKPAPKKEEPKKAPPAHDSAHMAMPDTMRMVGGNEMKMSMNGPLGISMDRTGSGTTWIPDDVALPAAHFMRGSWMLMLHGFAFAQYDKQSGPRGDSQFGSLNWAMLMASHDLAGGQLTFRFMPSLDAATVGKCGYPLLQQTGETCNGVPLVDRQHPHDFFMELAAEWDRAIAQNLALFVYAAPAGEPALGPVAFMHRPSAMDNALAPLGHHWQDATHISFGVATAGVYTRALRVEASAFNGIEPDENRWNLNPIELNSYSGRVTLNPDRHWSLTAGYGKIAEPEPGNPDASFRRLVLSAMHGRKLGDAGQWATTLVYGINMFGPTRSARTLIESEAVLDRYNTVFGRAEWDTKALTLGYIREIAPGAKVTTGLGASATVNFISDVNQASYGSRSPTGVLLFLRMRPSFKAESPMQGMQQHRD